MAPSLAATRPPTTTAASGFSGTVQYMAPEQLDGDAGDHRADIFAFGCVLYEMLAGRKAFEGASAVTVIAAIMSSEPPPIAALQSAHPLLDHVLRRCLEKDRERRWQSIGDVTGELRWIVDHPIAAAGRCRAAGATEPRRASGDGASRSSLAAAAAGGRRARPARTGRRAGPSRAPLRDLHGANRRSVDGAVAGRHADRLRREPGSRARALGPLARRRSRTARCLAPKAPAFRSGRRTAAPSGSSRTTS